MIITFNSNQVIRILEYYFRDYVIEIKPVITENHYEKRCDVIFSFIHKTSQQIENYDSARLILLFNDILKNNHFLVDDVYYETKLVNNVLTLLNVNVVIREKVSIKKMIQKEKSTL